MQNILPSLSLTLLNKYRQRTDGKKEEGREEETEQSREGGRKVTNVATWQSSTDLILDCANSEDNLGAKTRILRPGEGQCSRTKTTTQNLLLYSTPTAATCGFEITVTWCHLPCLSTTKHSPEFYHSLCVISFLFTLFQEITPISVT